MKKKKVKKDEYPYSCSDKAISKAIKDGILIKRKKHLCY